jgi:hypothetical protein
VFDSGVAHADKDGVDVMEELPAPLGKQGPSVSAMRLTGAFLLSGLACGAIIGACYLSLVLWLFFEDFGLPVTACIGAVLGVKVQQAIVLLVTAWRPSVLRLLLAGIPAAALALGLHSWLQSSSWRGWAAIVAAGLVVQALVLHYLACARTAAPNHYPNGLS